MATTADIRRALIAMLSGEEEDERPRRRRIEPAQQPSVLSKLASGVGSGFVGTAALLDLPFSSIRDVMAGERPFDQWATPFDYNKNRTTVEQQFNKWFGEVPENAPFLNRAARFGGQLGYSILFDPITYATFGTSGALTKAGLALSKAGGLPLTKEVARRAGKGIASARLKMTPRDVFERAALDIPEFAGPGLQHTGQRRASEILEAFKREAGPDWQQRMDEPISGFFGAGLPFQRGRAVSLAGGKVSEQAAKAADVASKLAFDMPYSPLRVPAALFSHKVRGALEPEVQAMLANREPMVREAIAMGRRPYANIARQMESEGITSFDDMLDLTRAIERKTALTAPGAGAAPTSPIERIAQQVKTLNPYYLDAEQRLGLKTKELEDAYSAYTMRVPQSVAKPTRGMAGRQTFEMRHPGQLQRQPELTNLPGGTAFLQRISIDPDFSGAAFRGGRGGKLSDLELNQLVNDVRAKYGPDVAGVADRDLRKTVRTISKWDPKHADEGIPRFKIDPIEGGVLRSDYSARATEAADAYYEMLVDSATRLRPRPGERMISVDNVVKGTRSLEDDQALGQLTARLTKATGRPIGKKDLDEFEVPLRIAKDMQRVFEKFTEPKEVHRVIQAYDNFTNTFKGAVTTLFPAFHSRNNISAFVQNVFGDAYDPFVSKTGYNPAAYVNPYIDAGYILLGKGGDRKGLLNVPGFRQGGLRTEKEAADQLANEAFQHRVISMRHGASRETVEELGSVMQELPGLKPQLLTPRPKSVGPVEQWNPLTPFLPWGDPAAREARSVYSRTGRDVARHSENMARLSPFIAFRKQGFSAGEAAAKVRALQVDYEALSLTERSVMRRIFPFYTFSKKMAEHVADTLLHKPGGKLGSFIKGAAQLSDIDPTSPEDIRSSLAFRMPKSWRKAPDIERFLTGFGLAHEDPLNWMGGAGPMSSIYDIIGRSNPALRAPLEAITGQSFWKQGRKIEDLDPSLGRIGRNVLTYLTPEEQRPLVSEFQEPVEIPRWIEMLTGAMPFTRAVSTLKTLGDPRKDWGTIAANLGTGLRFSDVSPGSRAYTLRTHLQNLMKEYGGKQLPIVNIKKEVLEALPEEEKEQAKQLKAILSELNRISKRRKKDLERQRKRQAMGL